MLADGATACDEPEMDYPTPISHRTDYQLTVPTDSVAARIDALEEAGVAAA